MDLFESTKVVFERIKKLEPQNVSKIIGHLLQRDVSHLEMIRLAFCPDHVLQTLIDDLTLELHLSPKPTTTIPPPLKIPTPFTRNGLWIPQMPISPQLVPLGWFDSAAMEYGLHHQFSLCYPTLEFKPPPRLLEMGMQQVCNGFRQGYCKYGGSCKFLHVFQLQNGDCIVLNPTPPTPLKLLEVEIIRLLRSTQGIPVSVSSLPILYYDRYRKVLQVEGYHMENHRQGRFTSRMIQLLARMTTTTIRITNRPHRRQSILLDEDMGIYAKFKLEKGHELQVYLTFAPESIFSEQDVYNYFNNFGPVQEVRIPNQMHRMFGFVSFVYPETAALVLTKINPHYICGAQVLVKPYRFKPFLVERNNEEKVRDQIIYNAARLEDKTGLLKSAKLKGTSGQLR